VTEEGAVGTAAPSAGSEYGHAGPARVAVAVVAPVSSAPKRRERLSTEERREQLTLLGSQLFTERSFDTISIDEIAERAGISEGLLYHYFPTKRDFYAAAVECSIRDLHAATEPDPALAPGQRLRASLDTYLRYVEENFTGVAALLRAGIGADAQVGELVEGSRIAFAQRVLDALVDLGADVERPGTRVAVRGWVGYVEASTLEWVEHGGQPRDAFLELLSAVLFCAVEQVAGAGKE